MSSAPNSFSFQILAHFPWLLLLLLLPLLVSFSPSFAQPDFRIHTCNNDYGNYTNTSTYLSNLNILLSGIASHTGDPHFYNLTSPANSGVDSVYGIAFCRRDKSPSFCRSCIVNATQKIRAVCPNQKEPVAWYNECMLRYSNRSIFATVESMPTYAIFNTANASDPGTFNQKLGDLLRRLQTAAAAGDSRRKFAADGPVALTDFESLYALVECTPDLTGLDCSNCIEGLINNIPESKIAGWVFNPSCEISYDRQRFYDYYDDSLSPPSPSPAMPNATVTDTPGQGSSKGVKIAIAVAVPTVACTVLVAVIFRCCFFKRKTRDKVETSPFIHEIEDNATSIESLRFDFTAIRGATNNFSDASELGRGGFGAVYKGMLANGQQIAVKRLAKNSSQGEQEFKNEVLLVAKLQHRNLVRLLGFCLDGEERVLIYELLPNSSLDHFLFDPIKRSQLGWQIRYKIITGISRGMLYLHEDSQLRIIHRDLKASNVLLDAEMNAKISDFGMARLFHVDQTHGDTNRVVGTYGYMAPEYALHGFFSVKSDVYSFGVLVLEMITGRKSIGSIRDESSEDLISFVWRNWREGTPLSIIDESISASSRTEIMRCIHIGLLCVQEDPTDRPTMSAVVVMMSSQSFTLPMPSHPAFVTRTLNLLDTLSEEHSLTGTISKNSKSNLASQKSVNVDSDSEFFPR